MMIFKWIHLIRVIECYLQNRQNYILRHFSNNFLLFIRLCVCELTLIINYRRLLFILQFYFTFWIRLFFALTWWFQNFFLGKLKWKVWILLWVLHCLKLHRNYTGIEHQSLEIDGNFFLSQNYNVWRNFGCLDLKTFLSF